MTASAAQNVGRSAGRAARALLGGALLALAVWSAAPAQAAPPQTIAGLGAGAGKVDNPRGVAVDQASGELYVADRNNYRIDRFDAEGQFLLAWGWGVADGKSQELQVCGPAAVPPAKRCFKGLNATGPGAVAPRSVAVGREGGEAYVYVIGGGGRRVTKFSSAGEFVFMVGKDVNKTKAEEGAPAEERNICRREDIPPEGTDVCGAGQAGSGANEFSSPDGLAVDAAGQVWVGDADRIAQLDPSGAPGTPIPLPGAGSTDTLAVDSEGNFFTVRQEIDEIQQVELDGFAEGDEFILGNLPGHCDAASTEEISFATGLEGDKNVTDALEDECGEGSFKASVVSGSPPFVRITFEGPSSGVDEALLSCTKVTGGGSCSVAVQQEGRPGRVEKLQAGTGAVIGTLAEGSFPRALGIDGEDNLYLGDCNAGTFPCPYSLKVYDSSGALVSVFGAGQVLGGPTGNALAVDEGSPDRPPTLYTASSEAGGAAPTPAQEAAVAVQAFSVPEPGPLVASQRAEGIGPTGASLKASLNPEGSETDWHFEYDTSPYEGEAEHGTRVPEEDETLPASFEETEVGADLSGLIPDTTYHFRLSASSSEGTAHGEDGEEATFTTLAAIGIEAQWATEIAATSATLRAELDPRGAEGAKWWVRYGVGGVLDRETAKEPLVPGKPVSLPLTGLDPATPYSYRFVAEGDQDGASYEVPGPERSFATQRAGLGSMLPDDRAWEMVSPPAKHGGRIAAPDGAQGGHLQAAADGDALAYLSYGSLEANPEGNRLLEQSSQLARRAPGGAWSTTDITPPHGTAVRFGVGSGAEYKLLSANLERSLLQPRDCTPLSPAASERTPYLRENAEPPAYEPLVNPANVPAGTDPFGGDCDNHSGAVSVLGGDADLSHVVLGSSVPLAPGVCHEVTPGTGRWDDSACSEANAKGEGDWEGPASALYGWSAGALAPLSLLPESEGGKAVVAELGAGTASVRNAVSADGSRVFWTAKSGGLYARDTAREETARLDEVQEGAFGTGEAKALFQGASADGRYAFFTDTHNLTEDANEEGADLYRCELVIEGGELECDLTDISADTENPDDPFEGAKAQDLLPGIGEDGKSASLLARGVLDAEPREKPNGELESAVPGEPNLYAWREGEGMRFIARLAEADEHAWGGPFGPLASQLTAAASPSGRYLAFMSERPLTGYDNRAQGSGTPAQEVFRYDAEEDELACASCNPSGARPRALVPGREGQLAEEFDPQLLWEGQEVAAVVPEATEVQNSGASLYRPRYVHDNGRVFFNAADALVAADSNGDGDVYQYEPHGAGDCTASSGGAGAAQALEGGACVSLISSGTAAGTAAFLDSSAGGRDVFFYSPARLAVTDVDAELDVYDARVNGTPAVLSPSAECQGEACQPPAIAPELKTPASAAFRGPGNLRGTARGRCAKPARAAKRLSRRAKALRKKARAARRNGKGAAARKPNRRARRLARRAKRMSKRAKRCRARARANRRSRK